MRRIVAMLLLSLFAVVAFAEDQPPTTAQAVELARLWLDAQRQYDEVPGLSVSIVHDQRVLWTGGMGMADPATGRAATADTLYSICSISKLFTGIAVMQLRDAGKLSLSDPVTKHLPWFKMAAAPGGRDATILGILTHSAGLPRESDFPYWTGEFDFPTREKVMERIASQQPIYPSERYFQYSNLGLTLAGEIVSARSGVAYDEYVRKNILAPLQMTSTYPEIPLEERGKRLAAGFSARRRDGTRAPMPLFQTRAIAPAAGFASSANDLAKFAMWQFRTRDAESDPVLDPRTLREMQRPHWVDAEFQSFRGIGFGTWKRGSTVFVGHNGHCPGFRTQFTTQPEKKVAVIVLSNANAADVTRYAEMVYEIVAPTLRKQPAKDAPASPSMSAYTGSYSDFPWGGESLIVAWGDGLAMLEMPVVEPMRVLERYRKIGEHTFRRVLPDGALGEEIRFEIGPDGRATRYWHHSNPWPRM